MKFHGSWTSNNGGTVLESTDGAFNGINPQNHWARINELLDTEASSYGIAVLDSARAVPTRQENTSVAMSLSALLRIA